MLLELADSQITYRLRYVMVAARAPVIDLVALDPNNPRSIVYQLARIETHLAGAAEAGDDSRLSPPEQIAIALATKMRTADVAAIDERGVARRRSGADEAVRRGRLDLFHDARALRSAVGGARMIYDVRQETIYHYASPVAYAHHVLRLTPIDRADQRVHAAALDITPTPIERREGQDFFGNRITWIALDQPHDTLTVRVAARVAVEQAVAVEPGDTPPWEEVREAAFASADPSPQSPAHFLFPSRQVSLDPEIRDYVALSFPPGRAILDGAIDLMNRIKAEFVYEVGATTASTTPPMSFALRRGVCQDFTHIMISGMRSLGLPVAYVSGYLRTVQSPAKTRLEGADAMHAWVLVVVRAGCRLDRPRSDQRHPRRQRPRRARDRSRLRRRRADRRRHLRLRRAAAGDVGACRAGRLIVKRHNALQFRPALPFQRA